MGEVCPVNTDGVALSCRRDGRNKFDFVTSARSRTVMTEIDSYPPTILPHSLSNLSAARYSTSPAALRRSDPPPLRRTTQNKYSQYTGLSDSEVSKNAIDCSDRSRERTLSSRDSGETGARFVESTGDVVQDVLDQEIKK